jgi:hypothetical protein
MLLLSTNFALLPSATILLGTVDWCTCFGMIPTLTVNQLAFGPQVVTKGMVFDQEGLFRFIRFKQDEYEPSVSEVYSETQALFQSEFARLFGEKLEDDPSFVSEFVSLCTGSSFIPDVDFHPDYCIQVEFNASEMTPESLPTLHTCDNLMKIPALAYDGDMEVFQEKLAITMRHSGERFDMQ